MMDRNRIYTSYFSSPHLKNIPEKDKIAISISVPENWGGRHIWDLAPFLWMLTINKEQYRKNYLLKISKYNPKIVGEKLLGKVLVCWEEDRDKCHRSILGGWLQEAGFVVEEFMDGCFKKQISDKLWVGSNSTPQTKQNEGKQKKIFE